MRAPPGVDLRGLLILGSFSQGAGGRVTFVLFSGACLSRHSVTRRLKVAILSLGSSKAYTISNGKAAKSSIKAVSENRFSFLMSLCLGVFSNYSSSPNGL